MWITKQARNAASIVSVAKRPSFYPEKPRKSGVRRLLDLTGWYLRYGEVGEYYNLYGCDLKNVNCDDYLDYRSFMKTRDEKNQVGSPSSQIGILQDKYQFFRYMSSAGIPNVPVIGLIRDGSTYDADMIPVNENELLENEENFFIKAVDGLEGLSVFRLKNYAEYLSKKSLFQSGRFIVQRCVRQSENMNRMYDGSVNTLRIVTVRVNGEVRVLDRILRIGCSRTGFLDNFSSGGLVAHISEDGTLGSIAISRKANKEGKFTFDAHPDSKTPFAGFQIERFEEAIDLAKSAHSHLDNLFSVGWDVVMTDNGPILLEGNDNWGITSLQSFIPMRKIWTELIT